MNIIRKLAKFALPAAVLAALLGTTVPASAATTPVVPAANTGWSGMVRTPARFYIGNGGSPYMTRLTWPQWAAGYANGTGQLWLQSPTCTPTYLCPAHEYNVRVYLHRVITHNGVPVFSRMRWDYGRVHHIAYLYLDARGYWGIY